MARSLRHARRKPRELSSGVLRLTRRGYGFVRTAEGEYLILPSQLHGAMDGDLVEVTRRQQHRSSDHRPTATVGAAGSGRPGDSALLGAITRVLQREHQTVIGRLQDEDGLRSVQPLDYRIPYDIFIDSRLPSQPAQPDDVVVVRLTTWPSKLEAASGYIEAVIGGAQDNHLDTNIICWQQNIRTVFPAAVLAEARARQASQQLAAASLIQTDASGLVRRDLRDRVVFTIDPPDARDFDDALSLDFLEGNWQLGVHIADVSSFVPLGSTLEIEARARGTSVYLPDRVIPMLPEELSSDLCSLQADQDRQSFSLLILLDKTGQVLQVEFTPAWIRSAARLNYPQVDALLAGQSPQPAISAVIAASLRQLDRLAGQLKRRRLSAGALDFDSPEAHVLLDATGHPTQVQLRRSTPATALVEEAMILANVQVAEYMLQRQAPMIYRTHQPPVAAALLDSAPLLTAIGYLKSPDQLIGDPRQIQSLLQRSAGRAEQALVHRLLLRCMSQARYTTYFNGHYGLAAPAYCHFTSPIRRYPDLLVHHLLKLALADQPVPAILLTELDHLAAQSSERERAAEVANRQAVRQKLVEYLSGRVGEVFTATILEISAMGLVIMEEQTTASGLVPRSRLDDFEYDAENYQYLNPANDDHLHLGQRRSFRLRQVNLEQGWLDFDLA